jgi:hypothetical protein
VETALDLMKRLPRLTEVRVGEHWIPGLEHAGLRTVQALSGPSSATSVYCADTLLTAGLCHLVLHKVTVRTAPVLVFPSLVSLVCVDCLNDTTAYPYKRRDYVSPLPFSQESLPQLKALHANLCVDLFVQFTHLDML